jgi:serine/threonine protein kinase
VAVLPLVGEEFAGYRLVSVLGRGGMSIVFRAENPRLGNVIALKILDPVLATDDVFRTRFLEESRIAASMNHPNVIPIHDMGSNDGLLYIAMRCVMGTDLRQMLKKRGRLPPETAIFLLEQAARALDAAHRRGLVHRDVKPGNLLIERGNDGTDPEHVYLTDFGITKHLEGRTGLTSTGAFMGTVDYVAPEQIRGTSVLGFADQYSLGCVLYECLTGRVPFEKDFDAAIIFAHVEEAPTLPTVLRPDLPPALNKVFARVLSKDPGDRYGTCREFMVAARGALGPMAEPPPPSDSLKVMPRSGPVEYPTVPPGAGQAPYPPAPLAHEPAPAFNNLETADWPAAKSAASARALPLPPPPVPPAPSGGRSGPPHRRWRTQGWLVIALGLILLVAGGTGAALSRTGGNGTPLANSSTTGTGTPTGTGTATGVATATGTGMPSPTTSASMTMPPSSTPVTVTARTASCAPGGTVATAAQNRGQDGPTTLAGVLQQANLCSTPEGILPPSSCMASGSSSMTCMSPVAGITEVTFTTYPSRTDLYTNYMNQITVLNGSFGQNTMNSACGPADTAYAEAGWNHLEKHPKQYTVTDMESTTFNQVDAMGRQACGFSNGKPYMVWTTDVGNMLAVASGSSSMKPLYEWWAEIHHVIIFRGTEMCGQAMGRMASVPQGNLISAMVCPSGVAPGSSPSPSMSSGM